MTIEQEQRVDALIKRVVAARHIVQAHFVTGVAALYLCNCGQFAHATKDDESDDEATRTVATHLEQQEERLWELFGGRQKRESE